MLFTDFISVSSWKLSSQDENIFMIFLACLNPTSANSNLKSTEKFERESRQLLSDSQFVNEEAFTTLQKGLLSSFDIIQFYCLY